MYLSAHRVRRLTGDGARVGINTFLHRHEESDLLDDLTRDDSIVDRITNENPGKLIAESVDLVPGGNAVLSYVDVVGREGLEKQPVCDYLCRTEGNIECHFQKKQQPFTDAIQDIAVKFGISYGLRGQEVREYKALAGRAIRLFESPEPPRWRTETPWIVIEREICDNQERFSLTLETAEKLRQINGETWVSTRVSIDQNTERDFVGIHGDLIQHIAPILTGLTLEQIAAQGGLILEGRSSEKTIKWPELKEL